MKYLRSWSKITYALVLRINFGGNFVIRKNNFTSRNLDWFGENNIPHYARDVIFPKPILNLLSKVIFLIQNYLPCQSSKWVGKRYYFHHPPYHYLRFETAFTFWNIWDSLYLQVHFRCLWIPGRWVAQVCLNDPQSNPPKVGKSRSVLPMKQSWLTPIWDLKRHEWKCKYYMAVIEWQNCPC